MPVSVVPKSEGKCLAVRAVLIGSQRVWVVGDGIEVFVGHNQVPIDRLVIDVSTWIEPGRLEELLRAAVGVDQLFAGVIIFLRDIPFTESYSNTLQKKCQDKISTHFK